MPRRIFKLLLLSMPKFSEDWLHRSYVFGGFGFGSFGCAVLGLRDFGFKLVRKLLQRDTMGSRAAFLPSE